MIKLEDGTILDLVPDVLKENLQVQAFSYAFKNRMDYILACAESVIIYPAIDSAPMDVLDNLAVEMRTQHYDQNYDIDKKRALIKNTLQWYMKAGTKWAVEDLAETVFGAGTRVLEYADSDHTLEDALKPYEFEIRLPTTSGATTDNIKDFNDVIETAKNARSHLKDITTYALLKATGYFGAKSVPDSYRIRSQVDLSTYSKNKPGVYLDDIYITNTGKKRYTKGDAFNTSGLTVTAVYTDGSEKTVSADIKPLNGTTLSTTGEQTITAVYKESGRARVATYPFYVD